MDEAQGRWACVQVPAGENQGEVRQVGDSGERESIEYMVRHSVQVQLIAFFVKVHNPCFLL